MSEWSKVDPNDTERSDFCLEIKLNNGKTKKKEVIPPMLSKRGHSAHVK